ncbi:MAG TPA: transcription-repair coupling factor [Candidatus Gastranaerophilales bacterium]|nr:transcription-repair coupling factor [Candidatus Gastranaerophilales bacterium]
MSENIHKLLNKLILKSVKFKKLIKSLENRHSLYLTGLTGSARNFFAAKSIKNLKKPVLVITPDIASAIKYTREINLFSGKKTSFLPSQESSPYEQVYSDPEVTKQQLNALQSFANSEVEVIVTPAKNLLNTLLEKNDAKKNSVKLELKGKAEPYDTAEKFISLGYKRVTTVIDPGEFSLRGDILDIYPISQEPLRIEFFCEEVESLRVFNIETQRSIRKINAITIEPRYKILLDNEKKNILIKKLVEITNNQEKKLSETAKETLKEYTDNFISMLEADSYTEGIEYLYPLLNNSVSDIFDYLPDDTVIFLHESAEIIQRLHVQDDKYLKEYEKNVSEGLAVELPFLLHHRPEEVLKKLYKYPALRFDSFIDDEADTAEELESSMPPKFLANLHKAAEYIINLKNKGFIVLIDTEYPQRVASSFKEAECPCLNTDEDEINPEKILETKEIIVSHLGFEEGFVIPEINLAIITDVELFNKKIKKATLGKSISRKESIDYLVSVNDFKENDFVVHSKHGIGRFLGLCKQEIDGQLKDYLTIEYTNADKLYMPAEQINFLSRYRGSGTLPKLSKMGGTDWAGVKTKVKKAVTDIAEELLKLYAKRARLTGFVFEQDTAWQMEMENAFPYTETPDQMQAIMDTKADMETDKILDRLICGDVGFGKTEVALRAVFKAVLSGKQTAVLVPTTILAQQHYNTFKDRLSPYPVDIELLSRFRSPKEQKETLKKLLTGECDIVIGTHRLLQKDIKFKNLGFLVIDEEHRFGVSHKEKIKQFKTEIDALTLTATPIPRTLNMALSGLKEMSIINTPPINRAPIKTYVGAYNESLVKTAISHELEREGQIYFLHNRVESIYKVADELQKLAPEARIAVGHGQMREKELEKVMYEFSANEHDILVCTTIIESGLDIPNANTIIIDNADKFGLAQLYQIRGRVGRSERQAYAYCLYKPNKILTAEAKDRLKAIKDFTTLGSGYQIALRDLEIRGIGNLLGSQQHGHMLAVGFDMYCNLLEETIQELKGEKINKKDPTIIDINITAFIPDDWAGEKEQKMVEYKRLADVSSPEELEVLRDEWIDRFGGIPIEVERLIKIIQLRLMATEVAINLIRETFSDIRIFSDYTFTEFQALKSKLNPKIAGNLKWTKAPLKSENGSSVIILDISYFTNDDKLNILEEIFKIAKNFKNIQFIS